MKHLISIRNRSAGLLGTALLLGTGGLLASAGVDAEPAPNGPVLDIYVDATHADGTLHIREEVHGLPAGEPFWWKSVANPAEIKTSGLVAKDGSGATLDVPIEKRRVRIAAGDDAMSLEFIVRPGGIGRHGHQGLVTKRWAAFDGRVLWYPKDVQKYADVRWHFEVPKGWNVASAMDKTADGAWHLSSTLTPRMRASITQSGCIGLGPFSAKRTQLGDTELRVWTFDPWEDAATLADKSTAMGQWFHTRLGFDLGRPFSIVFTPPGPEMATVWSGAGASGTCYERPQAGMKNWLLLGHRFAHPINEYAPDGIYMARPEDQWFMEGWASYIEVLALSGAGIQEEQLHFNGLYNVYNQKRDEHPHYAHTPLADDHSVSDPDQREYMHYLHGPLVVRMLAEMVKVRSGKNLEDFMAEVFRTHGGFAQPLDLRNELEAWSGAPLDDFWEVMVDQNGPVVPVWPEYQNKLDTEAQGTITAGSSTWSSPQLNYLLTRPGHTHAAGLKAELERTAQAHEALARRKIFLVPPNLVNRRLTMTGPARANLDQLTRMWPTDLGPQLPSGGCNKARDPVALPPLRSRNADGEIFLRLAELDTDTALQHGNHDISGFVVSTHDPILPWPSSEAVVKTDKPFKISVSWSTTPGAIHIEIWQNKHQLVSRPLDVEVGWSNAWLRVHPEALDGATGIMHVRLVDASGTILAQRPIWRR
ncbi:MAG: hypothetical protein GWP91_16040 [Rhodobacterales bacterium]|nr:hypothetical protein [Rhodobacterales bacterium]